VVVDFYLTVTKVCINFELQPNKHNQMLNMIDLSVDTMPHQLKGIRNGRQDVRQLLFNMWRSFWEQTDEVNDSVYNWEEHANIMYFFRFSF